MMLILANSSRTKSHLMNVGNMFYLSKPLKVTLIRFQMILHLIEKALLELRKIVPFQNELLNDPT